MPYHAEACRKPAAKRWSRRRTRESRPGWHRFTHHLKESLKHTLLPCSMFENMGFTYLGPVNGHNVEGEAGQSAELTDGVHGLSPPGEHFMDVALVRGGL